MPRKHPPWPGPTEGYSPCRPAGSPDSRPGLSWLPRHLPDLLCQINCLLPLWANTDGYSLRFLREWLPAASGDDQFLLRIPGDASLASEKYTTTRLGPSLYVECQHILPLYTQSPIPLAPLCPPARPFTGICCGVIPPGGRVAWGWRGSRRTPAAWPAVRSRRCRCQGAARRFCRRRQSPGTECRHTARPTASGLSSPRC